MGAEAHGRLCCTPLESQIELEAGLARSGRTRADLDVVCAAMVVTADGESVVLQANVELPADGSIDEGVGQERDEHPADADAEVMEARERTLLAAAGRTRP